MKTLPATFEGIAIEADGTQFAFRVSVGPLYQQGGEPDTWRCPASVEPWHPQPRHVAGGDAFQALCLASRLALDLLRQFIEGGGRLTYDGANDVPLDAYIPAVPRA